MKKFGFVLLAVLTIFAGFHFYADDANAAGSGSAFLHGAVVDAQGYTVIGAHVKLYDSNENVVATTSVINTSGYRFNMDGKPNGIYRVQAIESQSLSFPPPTTLPLNGMVTVNYQGATVRTDIFMGHGELPN